MVNNETRHHCGFRSIPHQPLTSFEPLGMRALLYALFLEKYLFYATSGRP